MQFVKIQIPDQPKRAMATVEMSRRGRIDCYLGHIYMVPEPALDLLKELGVSYKELGRGGMDYAQKTLRDTLAAHEKRRRTRKPRKVRTNA